jgi:hypothetical protein
MERYIFHLFTLLVLMVAAVGCGKKVIESTAEVTEVAAQVNKFAPVHLRFDPKLLDANETAALEKIVQAATFMDEIFLNQVYSQNEALQIELLDNYVPETEPYLQLFQIMFGPFNRLEEDKPFINHLPKPVGANFYPEEMTKSEFLEWIETHPADKAAFEDTFTRIVRKNGNLVAVPYSEAYKVWLKPAAQLLREAAELTQNASLKKYLLSRADAFLSNDYYQSDMDWMDLDSQIEVVIGPYEVYEDKMFNYKAAFEAFVTIVDPVESKKLEVIGQYLNELEQSLPIKDAYKNFNRGVSSPVKVVQEVFSAGDTKAGVQTLAFNLPNDERVRQAKGSKKVMLKNIAEAKFEKIYLPIAQIVLSPEMLAKISFDHWFTHVLMHEATHGLGPGIIKQADGSETTVQKLIKETYSAIEECKADVGGMYTYAYLCNQGVFPAGLEEGIYPTFLGGIFRSVRFGAEEAHGKANLIAFNFILEKGGYSYDPATQTYAVDYLNIRAAVKDLLNKLLTIEAEGDYAGAKALIEQYGKMPEHMQQVLTQLGAVPVDIRPEFEILKILQ